jgi:hypothetical protein
MSAPTLRIQLTRTESLLVYPGMALISAIHKLWRETSELPMAHPDLRTGGCPRGQYEPAFGELIVKLESTFAQSRFHRSRLRLTVFELALCALAVRVTNTRVKHGHLMRWRRNHDLATGRLLQKLENARRRAKRAFTREFGKGTFSAASRQWHRMLVFIRNHFLRCGCNFRVWAPGLRNHFRRIVSEYRGFAIKGLKRLHAEIPPETELLRLIRLALAHIRRGRTNFGVRTLLEHPEFAATFLAKFIIARRSRPEKTEQLNA